MNKKKFLIIIVIILVFFAVSQIFKKEEKPFSFFEVTKDTVIENLWETGKVQRGERINLSFKNNGEIKKIYVQANQIVEKGEVLAELDTRDINVQLQEAQISLKLAQLNLEKLLAGASPEEIKIAETQTEAAQIALDAAEENLRNSYEQAVPVLNNAHPQIYATFNFAEDFVDDYVVVYDEDGRKIIAARNEAEESEKEIREYLEDLKADFEEEKAEVVLSITRTHLEKTFNNLESIRYIVNKVEFYQDNVSVSDKAYIDTLKTSVNAALSNVISSQQAIASVKLSVVAARKTLEEAQNRLNLAKSGARQVDIALYETQIKQAESRVELYQNQLTDAVLRSPVKAQVVAVNKKEGELVQAMLYDVIISLSPLTQFEIVANIYEEDIVKIKTGSPVEISLPAFPDKTFKGEVIFVDETEKIIDGVVYYEIKIAFIEEPPAGIRSTMTADIVIQSGIKENVLVVPWEAVQKVEGKTVVEISTEDSIQQKEVEVGLRGEDMVEIISGLEEGEKIILR